MRFAVIGDIHSNIHALEAVLKDIEEKSVDFIISTGDLVGYLPFPNEVIDLIRNKRILAVKGNHDDRVAKSSEIEDEVIYRMKKEEILKKASLAYTNWVIAPQNRLFLRNLPEKVELTFHNKKVLFVHGSHKNISEYLYEDSTLLSGVADEIEHDILICGHTHIPYHLELKGKVFINPGSVGKPKAGTPSSQYRIVSVDENSCTSELVNVKYELTPLINEIKHNSMISDDLINSLKEGC